MKIFLTKKKSELSDMIDIHIEFPDTQSVQRRQVVKAVQRMMLPALLKILLNETLSGLDQQEQRHTDVVMIDRCCSQLFACAQAAVASRCAEHCCCLHQVHPLLILPFNYLHSSHMYCLGMIWSWEHSNNRTGGLGSFYNTHVNACSRWIHV